MSLKKKDKIEISLITIAIASLLFYLFQPSSPIAKNLPKRKIQLKHTENITILKNSQGMTEEEKQKVAQHNLNDLPYAVGVPKHEMWEILKKEFPDMVTEIFHVCPEGFIQERDNRADFFGCKKNLVTSDNLKIEISLAYDEGQIAQYAYFINGMPLLDFHFSEGILNSITVRDADGSNFCIEVFFHYDNTWTNAVERVSWDERFGEKLKAAKNVKHQQEQTQIKITNIMRELCLFHQDMRACKAREETAQAKCY